MNHGTEKMMATAKKTTKTEKPAKATTPAKKAVKAKVAPVKKAKSDTWPKVVKGNHLTVTTYENGKTELVWDDEALLKEVRDAIMAYELANLKPAVRAKAITRAKKLKT